MRTYGISLRLTLSLFLLLTAPRALAQAGPPFQTDDPTPVDPGHYEFYVFGAIDGTPAELDPVGPAFGLYKTWGKGRDRDQKAAADASLLGTIPTAGDFF
jgi:hypothetical protein